jgi:hypothetical protein
MADLREQIDMTDTSAHCAANNHGAPCDQAPTATEPVALCTSHRMQVAALIVPEMMQGAMRDGHRGPRVVSPSMKRLIELASPVAAKLDGHHESCVYLISNGNRVKIGMTTKLGRRLEALQVQASDVHLLLLGGRELESALHEYFADFRLGTTEWFERSATIESFIRSKREKLAPQGSPRGVVTLHAAELREAVDGMFRAGVRGVLLADLLAKLREGGAPSWWNVSDLRRACEDAGIPVNGCVRANGRVSVGIRRDDFTRFTEERRAG